MNSWGEIITSKFFSSRVHGIFFFYEVVVGNSTWKKTMLSFKTETFWGYRLSFRRLKKKSALLWNDSLLIPKQNNYLPFGKLSTGFNSKDLNKQKFQTKTKRLQFVVKCMKNYTLFQFNSVNWFTIYAFYFVLI